jgi:intein/homing endonuclease
MRVILRETERMRYFSTLKEKASLSSKELCLKLKVDRRLFNSYCSGEFTIPLKLCQKIQKEFGIEIPRKAQIKPLFWHTRDAGKKGAIISYTRHGNPGTAEGRRIGGLNSLKSSKLKNSNFIFKKKIVEPEQSFEFAELIGALIGDGGISSYQVKVTLGLKTDRMYADHIKFLFESLFRVIPKIYIQEAKSTVEVVVSSRALVEYLTKLGLPLGDKIRQEIDIPFWIKNKQIFLRPCLRGIFDTDGCISEDRHNYKNSKYASPNISFKSASEELRKTIYKALKIEGFNPTLSSYRAVMLRKREEVVKFFRIIGSSNSKHIQRFNQFGGVPKRSYGHRLENGCGRKAYASSSLASSAL